MLLEIQNASRRFDGTWAVHQLTARIESGSIIAILGANGAGKSTLLRLLAGWLPLTEGDIRLDNSPLRPTATRLRKQVMLLDDTPKRDSIPAKLLAQQIRDYKADRPGIEDEVARWFDLLDITKVYGTRAGRLSKGQSFKMAMVGMFVIRPQIWLLDEPFSAGLDANGLQTLEEQIRLHRQSGGIILFSSQWPEHARRLADRALVLHDGRLVWEADLKTFIPAERILNAEPSLRAVLQGLGASREQ